MKGMLLIRATHQFSLLIWSPYPGVSTMFKRSLTPFSVITSRTVSSFSEREEACNATYHGTRGESQSSV